MAIRPPQSDAPSGKTDVDSARIVLVTGMSGAGRSSALGIFEDMGYEAVDNLPLSLLSGMIRGGTGARPLAIGVDIRTRDFGVESFIDELDRLDTGAGRTVETVYLDCDDEVLLQRYTETRRRHPLDADRPIPDVIKLERRLLGRLRDRADLVIDAMGSETRAQRPVRVHRGTGSRRLRDLFFVSSRPSARSRSRFRRPLPR